MMNSQLQDINNFSRKLREKNSNQLVRTWQQDHVTQNRDAKSSWNDEGWLCARVDFCIQQKSEAEPY